MTDSYKSILSKQDDEDKELESDSSKEESEENDEVASDDAEEEKQEKDKNEELAGAIDKKVITDNSSSDDSDSDEGAEAEAIVLDKDEDENIVLEDDIIINEVQSIPFTEKEEKEFLDSYDHFLKED